MPDNVNVIIEIPAHSDPVKYEVDKETGAMFVDRFMDTAMQMGWQAAADLVQGKRASTARTMSLDQNNTLLEIAATTA